MKRCTRRAIGILTQRVVSRTGSCSRVAVCSGQPGVSNVTRVLNVNDGCLAALRSTKIAVGVVPSRNEAPIDREPELREGEQEQ